MGILEYARKRKRPEAVREPPGALAAVAALFSMLAFLVWLMAAIGVLRDVMGWSRQVSGPTGISLAGIVLLFALPASLIAATLSTLTLHILARWKLWAIRGIFRLPLILTVAAWTLAIAAIGMIWSHG